MLFTVGGLLIAFLIATAMSFLLVSLVAKIATRKGMLDYPGHRQSHGQPTPTGGGLGMTTCMIFLSALIYFRSGFAASWLWMILSGVFVLAAMGWMDDRKPLSSRLRLLVQTLVACALAGIIDSSGWNPGWSWLVLWVLVLVGIMNAYNFMDGSNGMAGFQAVFSGSVLAIIFVSTNAMDLAMIMVILVGSCLGFLPLNFPRARIFMGDAGSVPVGFCLAAVMSVGYARGLISIPEAFLLLSLFLVDSSLTLLTRVIRRERWYTAHKQHIYQRLIAHGWSHSRVLLHYQAINIVLVAPALVLARMYPDLAWILAGVMFLLMSTGWYLASLRLGVRN